MEHTEQSKTQSHKYICKINESIYQLPTKETNGWKKILSLKSNQFVRDFEHLLSLLYRVNLVVFYSTHGQFGPEWPWGRSDAPAMTVQHSRSYLQQVKIIYTSSMHLPYAVFWQPTQIIMVKKSHIRILKFVCHRLLFCPPPPSLPSTSPFFYDKFIEAM